MSIIDIVLGALILFGLIRGFIKGLFVEVASLLALVLGVYGAIHFSNFASDFIKSKVEWNEKTINIIAFAVTFVVIVLVISLAGKALTKLADFAALGILNKLLGGVFGGLKLALILSVVLIVFDKINDTLPFFNKEQLKEYNLITNINNLSIKGKSTLTDKDGNLVMEWVKTEVTEKDKIENLRLAIKALNDEIVPTDPPVKRQLKMTHPGGGNLMEDAVKKVMEVEDILLVLGYEWD